MNTILTERFSVFPSAPAVGPVVGPSQRGAAGTSKEDRLWHLMIQRGVDDLGLGKDQW